MFATTLMFLAVQGASLDLPSLAVRTRPAVVKLVIEDQSGAEHGSGSGFFVSAEGRIVTNHHVIADAERLTAVLEGGRKVPIVGVLADDEAADLAVIQAQDGTFPFLRLGNTHSLRVGDELAVIGSPVGLESSLSNGILAAIREGGADREHDKYKSWKLQITAPISPGSSGSPVLTADGLVVGVAVGVRTDGQALNFAIPAEFASGVLGRITPGTKARPLHPSLVLRNLAISAGVFLLMGLAIRLSSRPERVRRGVSLRA